MSPSSTSCVFLRQHISGALGGQPNPIFFFTTWDHMKQRGIPISLPNGELRSAVAMAREMVEHRRLPHLYGRFLPGIEKFMRRALAGVDEVGDEIGGEMGGGMAEKMKEFARSILSPVSLHSYTTPSYEVESNPANVKQTDGTKNSPNPHLRHQLPRILRIDSVHTCYGLPGEE
jgi:hypothetical protein